jgi:hypothetical protein
MSAQLEQSDKISVNFGENYLNFDKNLLISQKLEIQIFIAVSKTNLKKNIG